MGIFTGKQQSRGKSQGCMHEGHDLAGGYRRKVFNTGSYGHETCYPVIHVQPGKFTPQGIRDHTSREPVLEIACRKEIIGYIQRLFLRAFFPPRTVEL